MTTQDVLAMDAGQSGVRTQLRRGDEVLAEREVGGVLTDRPLLPQLATIAREALLEAGGRADMLAIGSSGLTPEMEVADLLGLLDGTGIREVRLAHDSITSYLAVLGDQPGVVVAAGTGVVTLAAGERDVARVDGWGYLIGDAGSGYWIGRAALDAVMRDHDGRGAATALTPLARHEFPDLESAYVELQSDEHKVSRIARWARTVADLAADGDEVCRAISVAAGRELATSALTGLRRVGEDRRDDPSVGLVGKVFQSPFVRSAFDHAVREAHPQVRIAAPETAGIAGATRLSALTKDSPLFAQLRVAGPDPR